MKLIMPSQPSTRTEIIKKAYEVAKASFIPTFGFYLIVILTDFVSNLIFQGNKQVNPQETSMKINLLLFVVSLIYIYITYWFIGAGIYRTNGIIHKSDPGFKQATQVGFKNSIPLFVTALLYGLAILFGTVLLIIPGIMASVYFVFTLYLVATGYSIIGSFKESYRLVKNHWWFTFFNIIVLILLLLLTFVIIYFGILLFSVGLAFLLNLISTRVSEVILLSIVPALFAISFLIIYVYSISFILVCLYDLQLRQSRDISQKR